MKTVGIVAEYNPFHNGHAYHLSQARQGFDCVVAVMSGALVQRGDVAICDKWSRAKMALMGGADLVLELPYIYCGQAARYFARGAVALLNAVGVDCICCGAEDDDIGKLQNAYKLVQTETPGAVKEALATGGSYAKAYAAMLQSGGFDCTPNNILALEYYNAIQAINPSIELRLIKRNGAAHDQADSLTGENIASASYIRAQMLAGENVSAYLPQHCSQIIADLTSQGNCPLDISSLDNAILLKLRTEPIHDLEQIADVTEGLQHRLKAAAAKATSFRDLAALVKTKRYTLSRIRRVILNATLGVTAADLAAPPSYIRVLGANAIGRQKLSAIDTLPIVTKAARAGLNSRAWQLDILAQDLSALCAPDKSRRIAGQDFLQSPIIIT